MGDWTIYEGLVKVGVGDMHKVSRDLMKVVGTFS